MKKNILLLFFLLNSFSVMLYSQNVTNVKGELIGTIIKVTYSLDMLADISLHVSFDSGKTFTEPLTKVYGDIGSNILPGNNTIIWDVLSEKEFVKSDNVVFLVEAKKIQIEMVFVKGGTFKMGCNVEQEGRCYDSETPQHKVEIDDFYIGKYEINQAVWKSIMGYNPSVFVGDNLPVENVTWYEVQEFIQKLNKKTGLTYRLPTEAEWEYAAKGGIYSKGFKFSGHNDISFVAWFKENSDSTTHPCGLKQPNELDIYDMTGNVSEWCYDYYVKYTRKKQNNPKGPITGYSKIVRKSSWEDAESSSKISSRTSHSMNTKSSNIGFRLVLVK